MQEAPIAQGPVDVNVSRQCTCHPDDNPPQPCEHRYAFRDCADAAEERYLRETLAILLEAASGLHQKPWPVRNAFWRFAGNNRELHHEYRRNE